MKLGRNAPCHCGSGLKFKRCCLNDDTYIIDGRVAFSARENSLMIMRVPPARQLEEDRTGAAVERVAAASANHWGLPDFVFGSKQVAKGRNGTRELGDRLIRVGEFLLSVQVKSRHAKPVHPEEERGWIERNAARALRQGAGTLRTLRNAPENLDSERGHPVYTDPQELSCVVVALIDHPKPPRDLIVDLARTKQPSVVLLRREWDFLFTQLRSTYAVAAYLHRVADKPNVLGMEATRYFDLAQKDAYGSSKHPTHPSHGLLAVLPPNPEDEDAYALIKGLYEYLATAHAFDSEEERFRVLTAVDSLPLLARTHAGRTVIDSEQHFAEHRELSNQWQMCSAWAQQQHVQLSIAVYSDPVSAAALAEFQRWVRWRHHQLSEELSCIEKALTVGILRCSPADGHSHPTTHALLVRGKSDVSSDELTEMKCSWELVAALDAHQMMFGT